MIHDVHIHHTTIQLPKHDLTLRYNSPKSINSYNFKTIYIFRLRSTRYKWHYDEEGWLGLEFCLRKGPFYTIHSIQRRSRISYYPVMLCLSPCFSLLLGVLCCFTTPLLDIIKIYKKTPAYIMLVG